MVILHNQLEILKVKFLRITFFEKLICFVEESYLVK